MDLTAAHFTNIFDFATEQGRTIVLLHYVDLAICLVIGLLVTGLIAAVALKFREKPGDSEPQQNEGNIKFEVIWTVVPGLILFGLAILTAIVMHSVNPPVGERKPDVIVYAHQWWWEYRYPKTGVVTANELVLPLGEDWMFEIRSADVVHSFWIPDFGQKMDAIPGHPNHVFFKPFKKGLFTGACSEFCGGAHSLMRIVATVVSPEEYAEWTKKQLHTPLVADDESAKRGEQLFLNKTCVQCHSVAGTDAKGLVGPDLSHVADRQSLASGVLRNNVDDMTKWIINPQKYKPGCHMPPMRLDQRDAHDIAVYLETLK